MKKLVMLKILVTSPILLETFLLRYSQSWCYEIEESRDYITDAPNIQCDLFNPLVPGVH